MPRNRKHRSEAGKTTATPTPLPVPAAAATAAGTAAAATATAAAPQQHSTLVVLYRAVARFIALTWTFLVYLMAFA